MEVGEDAVGALGVWYPDANSDLGKTRSPLSLSSSMREAGSSCFSSVVSVPDSFLLGV